MRFQTRRALPDRIHPLHTAPQQAELQPRGVAPPLRIAKRRTSDCDLPTPHLHPTVALDVAPRLATQTITASRHAVIGQPINIATRIRASANILQRNFVRTGRNPVSGINAAVQPILGQFPLAQHRRNVRFQQPFIISAGIVAPVAAANRRAEPVIVAGACSSSSGNIGESPWLPAVSATSMGNSVAASHKVCALQQNTRCLPPGVPA